MEAYRNSEFFSGNVAGQIEQQQSILYCCQLGSLVDKDTVRNYVIAQGKYFTRKLFKANK